MAYENQVCTVCCDGSNRYFPFSAKPLKKIKTPINDSVEKIDAGGKLVDQAGVRTPADNVFAEN